ncbi:hypothetical protein BC940DRAFT_301323 [Gongronella butleri]|nr:hypothetical protein BC940DRAFT_301323 [Gongronella butleri]
MAKGNWGLLFAFFSLSLFAMKHVLLAFVLPLMLPGLAAAQQQNGQAHLDQGNAHLAAGRLQEALISYDAAIAEEPQNYMSYYKRATAYLSLGRNQAAVDDFEKILSIKPDFDQALYHRARILVQQGDYDLARHDLQKYLEARPKNEKAIETMEALEHAEKDWKLAEADFAAKSYASCIDNVANAIRTSPNLGQLRRLSAKCHLGLGDVEAAAGDLSRAAYISPSDASLHTDLAKINFFLLGQPEGAIANLKQCLHYDPEQKQCKAEFKKLKKLNKAVKAIHEKIQEKKTSTATNQLIGTATREGLVVQIKKETDDALQALLPDFAGKLSDIPQRLLLSCYETACDLQSKTDNLDKTMEWCSATLSLDDSHVDALMHRGNVYLKQHEFEKAKNDLEAANEAAQGQNHQVRQLLQKAQNLYRQSKRRDYYKILGVPRDADARQIKKAYRTMAYENHPDRAEEANKQQAQEKMAEINAAYQVLSNDDLRQQFDQGIDPNDPEAQAHGGGHGGFPFQQGGHPFGGQFQGFPFSGGGFPGGGGSPFEFKMHF